MSSASSKASGDQARILTNASYNNRLLMCFAKKQMSLPNVKTMSCLPKLLPSHGEFSSILCDVYAKCSDLKLCEIQEWREDDSDI